MAWKGVVSAGAALACVALSVNAQAQTIKTEPARPIRSIEGVDTYKTYCATCHGPNAKGDGPAANALKKVPADLTTIARRHGGTFSQNDVEDVIMGTRVMQSHGSREMPIWGPVFSAIAPDPSSVKLRVANLVNYIRSIQMQ